MDAEMKQKIESWLSTKLLMAGIGIGCVQPTVTWDYRDTDLFLLQQKVGNCFTFSISGVLPEDAILEAYKNEMESYQKKVEAQQTKKEE